MRSEAGRERERSLVEAAYRRIVAAQGDAVITNGALPSLLADELGADGVRCRREVEALSAAAEHKALDGGAAPTRHRSETADPTDKWAIDVLARTADPPESQVATFESDRSTTEPRDRPRTASEGPGSFEATSDDRDRLPRRRSSAAVLAVVGVLLVGLALGALAVVTRSDDGSTSTDGGDASPVSVTAGQTNPATPTVALTQLQVGDCWEAGDGENRFIVLDCSQPHEAQVFAIFELTDEQLASSNLLQTAFDLCGPAFEAIPSLVSRDPAPQTLPSLPLSTNRTVACSAVTANPIQTSLL